jgi:hypothetical protein
MQGRTRRRRVNPTVGRRSNDCPGLNGTGSRLEGVWHRAEQAQMLQALSCVYDRQNQGGWRAAGCLSGGPWPYTEAALLDRATPHCIVAVYHDQLGAPRSREMKAHGRASEGRWWTFCSDRHRASMIWVAERHKPTISSTTPTVRS